MTENILRCVCVCEYVCLTEVYIRVFFNVIGLVEIQVLSGYFAIWFQESDEVSTCLTVERKLFEGV